MASPDEPRRLFWDLVRSKSEANSFWFPTCRWFPESKKKYTFVVLFGTVWGSVHLLCHGDVTQDDLWSMLKEMEDVVIDFRRRHHTSRIVIGYDLKIRGGLTSSRIHPNANSASSRWREGVTKWIHSLRLRASCIFELRCVEWDHDSSWKLKNSNKGGLFQLDYMLVRGRYHLNSDHWPIDAFLRLERKEDGARSINMSSRSDDGHLKMMRRSKSS